MFANYRNNISSLTSNVNSLVNDTSTLISRFAEKMNLSDTSNMLVNYRNSINSINANVNALASDTATLISRFGAKINLSDTSSMLANYRNNISSLTSNVNSLVSDTATLISRFTAKVNVADTAKMLTPYQKISPIVSSVVTGSTVTYTAFNPGTNFPRGRMEIGNSTSDNNVGFVFVPMFSSTGVQKPTFLEVSTNRMASDAGDKDLLIMVSPTQSSIVSEANGAQSPYTYAANPIYFQIQPLGSGIPNTGLIMNNDASNTITIGSASANTTAQLNVLHRSTLAAAWFDNKISIGANSGTAGQLLLNGSSSGTVTVQPAAAAGTWNLTLPSNTGTNGQVLQTNGSGVTSWANVTAGNSAITSVSSSYSVLTSDNYVIYVGASSSTITLPTAAGVAGKEYTIKNMSSSSVTVNTTSGQQIWEDATTQNTSATLGSAASNNWIKLLSDGTHWISFR